MASGEFTTLFSGFPLHSSTLAQSVTHTCGQRHWSEYVTIVISELMEDDVSSVVLLVRSDPVVSIEFCSGLICTIKVYPTHITVQNVRASRRIEMVAQRS
jgi:hypothetical protein